MNVHEAHIKVNNVIRDTILAYYDGPIDDDTLEAYGDIAETIVEALGLTVDSVDETNTATVTLDLNDF